jgi:DNA-3-methyladenine glycosylase
MPNPKRLAKPFFHRPTGRVARELIGKILCVKTERGVERSRIVETEAYLGVTDRAAHSFGGRRTARTEPMYAAGGHSYVYFVYGMHFCLNVTTGPVGVPEAVLIRAVEPLGIGGDPLPVPAKSAMRTNGPGKLCKFYGIERGDNGHDMTARSARIWFEDAPNVPPRKILTTTRIGIDGSGEAKDHLLRYALEGNPYVSGPLSLGKRK